jgi:hypothetical protein
MQSPFTLAVQAHFGNVQNLRCDQHRLTKFNQPYRLRLVFQRALDSSLRFTHFVLHELIFAHQLRSTYFRGKLNQQALLFYKNRMPIYIMNKY